MTALAETILAQQRYGQADLHDIRRAAERWWTLLNGSSVVGLSEPEQTLKDACATIMSRIRSDGLGQYRLTTPQMSFDEVSAA